MRIAYCITSLKIGGAEVALAQLAPRIAQQGHTVCVAFFHDGPIRQRLNQAGIPTYRITGLVHHYDPYAWLQLYRWLRTMQPDILHTALWSANILGRLFGKLLAIPVVSDLHGNCTKEGRIRNGGDRITAAWSTLTIAVSESVAQAYREHIIRAQKGVPLLTIPNAIDIQSVQDAEPVTRAQLGIPPTSFVVGSVGRLEPIKGYDLLLRACALLQPRPYIVLVGDGSEHAALVRLAHDLGMAEHLLVTGLRSDAIRFYASFDCFALSSHSEGLSLALLEAMACGLPIVTTSPTRTHDVITPGTNGLLVTERSPEHYAAALYQLQASPGLRYRLGKAARQDAEKHHSIETFITSVNAAYERLNNSNRK